MIKLIGAVLLVSGTAAWGLRGVLRLRMRSVNLAGLINALGIMQSEICDRLTPMPELLAQMVHETDGSVKQLFQNASEKMRALGNSRFSIIWRQAVTMTPELLLTEQEAAVMRELGQSLGSYNTEEQRNALMYTRRRMEEYLRKADATREANSKLHAFLGIAAGIFAVVILI